MARSHILLGTNSATTYFFKRPSEAHQTFKVVYDVLCGCPFFKAFLVTADVSAIYMQEFWATNHVHQHSIRFKMDNKKNIVDLEAFQEMLHISPRVPSQSFDELPFEEEILDFLRLLGHSAQIKTLTDVISSVNLVGVISQKKHRLCLSNLGRFCVSSGTQESKEKQRDVLPKIYKSHHSSLHDEETFNPKTKQSKLALRRDDILFSTIKVAYKEYYACATGEAAPKPKASARRKRGGSDSSTTPSTAVASPRPITTIAAAPRLTAAAKGKQPARETNEGTGSKPGVLDVPSDNSEEEISWNSSDDEDVDAQDKGRDNNEGKKNDEKIAKLDEQEDTKSGEGDAEETESDEESAEEETRDEEEESFDPIPRTPEDSGDDGKDEFYRDVDINQGRGLQVSQDIEDSHVTLTLVKPDGQQESSSVSSFVTSMLNPISDAGVESIFTTASSSIAPLQTSTPIMTPSTIATITISSDVAIPPTIIPSAVLQNLSTFDSVFRFEDRVKSLEVNFSEFMQTNQFAEAVSNIPDKTILESYGDTAILKRRCGEDDDQEGPSDGSDRGSKRRREGGEPKSASTPSEPATRSASRSTTRTQSRQMLASESAFAEEPVQTTCQIDEPHIWCLKQVQKINLLFKLLSILNGFPSQGNLQHRIVIGTRPCQLFKEALRLG
nr:hypothetical protein [Tanacetum cinerariifolium]